MSTLERGGKQAVIMMLRVIYALILRETKTRYGRLKIGYLWAFIEPILFISILSLIFHYTRRLSASEIPQTLFFTTGLLPFFLFREITNTTMVAVRQNSQLLYYPQVQIFDLCAARTLLELSTFTIVFSLLISVIGLSGIESIHIEDPLKLFQTVLLIALMGFGSGTIAGALIPLFPSVEFLTRMLYMLPMFWTSGIFFTADVLPPDIREIALLNPMLHLMESFRSAFFYEFESQYTDPTYMVGAILIIVLFGLLMQRALRRYAFLP